MWARGHCRISPPRFLAECCKRQVGNWTKVLLFCCILGCLLFLICIEFVYLYFPILFCLSVSVKWLAVKTASKMTYIVSSGVLNSTPTNQSLGICLQCLCHKPVLNFSMCFLVFLVCLQIDFCIYEYAYILQFFFTFCWPSRFTNILVRKGMPHPLCWLFNHQYPRYGRFSWQKSKIDYIYHARFSPDTTST